MSPPSQVILLIDPMQIRQALFNILLNAIDAMSKGGELKVATQTRENGVFEITIADTGCGIAREHLAHLFDPFFTQKKGGTGLGLSITYEIIKRHNGRIRVESEVGKGTRFTIELPIGDQRVERGNGDGPIFK